MALGLFFFGIIMLIAGWRGTYADVGERFAADVQGFIAWIIAVAAVGSIGYIPELKVFSDALLILIILVIMFSNRGVFAAWAQIASQPPQAAAATSVVPAADQAALSQNPTVNISFGSGSGSGSGIPNVGSAVGAAQGLGAIFSGLSGLFSGFGIGGG
jgi:hypothetical protein